MAKPQIYDEDAGLFLLFLQLSSHLVLITNANQESNGHPTPNTLQ